MKHMIAAALILAVSPALAGGEFSAGSKAKSWNLFGEESALFEGKVVDALLKFTTPVVMSNRPSESAAKGFAVAISCEDAVLWRVAPSATS